jgi:hypothetical protein
MRTRGILYWLWHDGPAATAVGPAWIIEADGTERSLNGGDWISRAEAERLAAVGEYILDAEDVQPVREFST